MDDYLGGANTVEEAVQLINDVIEIHANGGFQICNWISNSQNVLQQINADIKSNGKEINDGVNTERVLGLWWDYKSDQFTYKLKFHKIKNPGIFDLTTRPTKREVLAVVMSIFDPLGFLANFLIGGKILLQSIWESAIDWDDTLLDHQYKLWADWSKNFQEIALFSFPRMFTTLPIENCSVQLHIFCDASKYAYAACAYLRFEYDENVECCLILSKSRVAPLKPISIPRLELQGAVQGARLCHYLKRTLDITIDKTFLWSDSEVVLNWIRSSSKRFKVFVAQRLGEIQELTDTNSWRYVPSKLNVADDATKIKTIDFSQNSSWIKGPSFLTQNECNWPQKTPFNQTSFLEDEECQKEYVNVITQDVRESKIVVPDINRFSQWSRFLRTTAWIIRFCTMKRNKIRRPLNYIELQPDEIEKAEKLICRKIQADSYSDEIECLEKLKPIRKSSHIKGLPLVIDDEGLVRLTGRLNNVSDEELSYCSKNLILLDGKHPITRLLIDYYHRQNSHIATDTIISNLRKSYWITGCRNAVKNVSLNCQYCKNKKAKPQTPKMGQLPSCRVTQPSRVFEKTGVDYFGPIEVTKNRSHEKRYGVIFTCMATRAVHLNLAEDLSANSFLHVFRQFGCRRGFPSEIFSDNGTNFRKADKEIRQAIDSWQENEITQYMTMQRIKWTFNPPLTPHMGGAWERLIQEVKKHLAYLLKDKYPKEYVLRTLFCEIENMINSRPLTHIPLDCEDSIPITPNDFLIGPSSSSLQLVPTTDRDLHWLSMWRASQHLTEKFWRFWKCKYRQHILIDTKWSKDCVNLKVGDVVLVVDPDGPRNIWPKGIIIKTYPSADGRTRVVDVKTTTGIFRRSVVRLVKLEVEKSIRSP